MNIIETSHDHDLATSAIKPAPVTVQAEESKEVPAVVDQKDIPEVIENEPVVPNRESIPNQSVSGGVDLDLNMLGSSGFNVLHAACGSGNIEITNFLLKNKKVNPNVAGKDGWKALEIAA